MLLRLGVLVACLAAVTGLQGSALHRLDTADSEGSIVPIYWLHVPKTGSSFATTIMHFVAPGLPAEVTIRASVSDRVSHAADACGMS